MQLRSPQLWAPGARRYDRGVATLGVALLLVRGISEFGFDAILSNVVKQLYKQGETKETIKQKIEGYHVAKSLRFKLVGMLDSLPEEDREPGTGRGLRK